MLLFRPGIRRFLLYVWFALVVVSLLTYQLFFATRIPPPDPLRNLNLELIAQAPDGKPRVAFATFLSGPSLESSADDDAPDAYFTAVKLLVWQLIHAEATRSEPQIPVLVLTTSAVSEAKKARLKKMGATIVDVADIPLRWWHNPGESRWKDQFTKLRIFELVQWDLIAYIDADTLVIDTGNGTRSGMEGLFDDKGVRGGKDVWIEKKKQKPVAKRWVDKHGWPTEMELAGRLEKKLPERYILAARPDYGYQGERDHPLPPHDRPVAKFNAGFWIASPSFELYDHYIQIMHTYGAVDSGQMEQDLLNFAHRDGGPMPWTRVDWRWASSWPTEKDAESGVKLLHDKFWTWGGGPMYQMWHERRAELKEWEKLKFGDTEW